MTGIVASEVAVQTFFKGTDFTKCDSCPLGSWNLSMGLRTLRSRIGVVTLQTARPPAKTADPLYASLKWVELRDRVRREAGGRCQALGCGRMEKRMFVDHIVELQDGGAPLDRSNTWLLCASCHTRKTAAERARRT